MGICASNDSAEQRAAQEKNEAIERKLQNDAKTAENIHKLLLLGAGESGKSTLFKQMKKIYGQGFSTDDNEEFKINVSNNILDSIHLIISQVQDNYGGFDDVKEAADAVPIISELKKHHDLINMETGPMILALWNHPNTTKAMQERHKFQLVEGAEYFFGELDRIMQPDYTPSYDDILRTRVRTTGIVQEEFNIASNRFQIYDMGGQRSERKKWMNCFEGVTAVIFVSAISAFDQVLFEDNRTNRVKESLFLFKDICNAKWFTQTSMIVFLNKQDVFMKKLAAGKSIRTCFPDYTGDDSYEQSVEYMKQQFRNQRNKPTQTIFLHVTVATNTENITHVFDDVKNIVINRALAATSF